MNFLHKERIDGFDKRSLDLTDGELFCAMEDITILELEVKTSFYFSCFGKRFIVLKKGLRALKKVFQLFHDIAHYLWHGGREASSQAFFYGLIEHKNEIEADAFATVALVPRTMLDNYDFLDLYPRSRFARELLRERQRLAFLYQIK
jgi:Zn-dependent peptidase ImmA (M78 family)